MQGKMDECGWNVRSKSWEQRVIETERGRKGSPGGDSEGTEGNSCEDSGSSDKWGRKGSQGGSDEGAESSDGGGSSTGGRGEPSARSAAKMRDRMGREAQQDNWEQGDGGAEGLGQRCEDIVGDGEAQGKKVRGAGEDGATALGEAKDIGDDKEDTDDIGGEAVAGLRAVIAAGRLRGTVLHWRGCSDIGRVKEVIRKRMHCEWINDPVVERWYANTLI